MVAVWLLCRFPSSPPHPAPPLMGWWRLVGLVGPGGGGGWWGARGGLFELVDTCMREAMDTMEALRGTSSSSREG